MAEKGIDVKMNSPRSPKIGLWDSRSNKMIPSSLWVTHLWSYSLKIRPRGWPVTLPLLGSLSLLDRACELYSLGIFRAGNDDFSLAFYGGCDFQNFCNCPINYLPPESPKRTLAFFSFKVFSITVLSYLRNGEKEVLQNVRVPRVLSVAERELYGWVDEEIFTQPSVVKADMLPELRREMGLTVDRAAEWVYTELFTRLGVRLPFTEFQREVLSRCRVAASQLLLNGWGFLCTFERVCLHFGFRPSWRVFLYTYQLHAPPPRKGFLSFRVYQGRKLFDSFEESIQEFKWHYFKVLALPGKRPFWLNDEGAPFPWVYLNAEVGDFRVTALDPLKDLAFEFLQSLPAGLGKKSNFKCRWILYHNDADVGPFLDSLLKDMEKQSRFDHLMQKMKEVEGAGPRSILPSSKAQTTASGASASDPAAPASIPATSVPPAPSSSASKVSGKPTNAAAAKPFSVEREEGVREDPADDLRQKRRKRKVSEASAEEAALGVGMENTFAAKVRLEKELPATKDQVDVLTAERDSALAAPLLHAKIKSLIEELEQAEGEHFSAFDRMEEMERKAKVQAVVLESCRSTLAQERKKVESLSQSLKGKQTALDEAEAAAAHWRGEWRSLADETGKMVQETFEILMDQVRHLNLAIDYSMITLDTRWDPKAKRICNPKAEVQGQPEPMVDQPEPVAEEQRAEEVVAGEGGGCPT
ncbi:hypothetical protein PIB30_071957 [Stylosanthes scabra]|uniref:Uncharacterized protein n=1 Tax=Stylosanthes scabra TaxID=79078 RepID=A0ABU6WNS6_9FABA|nr:hypothetical protein [Stylosanthes scabra]